MKKTPVLFVGLLLGLTGCKSTDTPAPDSGLEGTWRLTNRQCYCTPAPVPNETVTFTDSSYRFVGSNRTLFVSGFYTKAAVAICGVPKTAPGLRLTDALATLAPSDVQAFLNGDTLVLDYGSPCDAPRDTYVRVQ